MWLRTELIVSRGRDRPSRPAPRTDPGVRNYRTGLLPWVLASSRTFGYGCMTRTFGSHRVSSRLIRAQVIVVRWLRRRSVLSQSRVTCLRKAPTAWVLSGTA